MQNQICLQYFLCWKRPPHESNRCVPTQDASFPTVYSENLCAYISFQWLTGVAILGDSPVLIFPLNERKIKKKSVACVIAWRFKFVYTKNSCAAFCLPTRLCSVWMRRMLWIIWNFWGMLYLFSFCLHYRPEQWAWIILIDMKNYIKNNFHSGGKSCII